MTIQPEMIQYKNGIWYVDVGAMSSKSVQKVMKEIQLGKFGLQVFMTKMKWKEVVEL